MPADQVALVQLLTLAGLVAATAQYAGLVRRRMVARILADQRAVEAAGLHGLVRLFLADA